MDRYTANPNDVYRDEGGGFVLYSDHRAKLKEADAERNRMYEALRKEERRVERVQQELERRAEREIADRDSALRSHFEKRERHEACARVLREAAALLTQPDPDLPVEGEEP